MHHYIWRNISQKYAFFFLLQNTIPFRRQARLNNKKNIAPRTISPPIRPSSTPNARRPKWFDGVGIYDGKAVLTPKIVPPRFAPPSPCFQGLKTNSTSRQMNSTSRQTNSTSRQINSTSRQTNSTSRQTNSTSRQTNSTSR